MTRRLTTTLATVGMDTALAAPASAGRVMPADASGTHTIRINLGG